MKTNELEKVLGVSKHTIRYYEKEGFVTPERDENGYRNYSENDIQTLQLVIFLRNLCISIDDVKAILAGELDFQECLKINQIHLEKQMENIEKIKSTIDNYHNKDLPLIIELSEFQNKTKKSLGFQKSTQTISLGRRLTPALAKEQFITSLIQSIIIGLLIGRFFSLIDPVFGRISTVFIMIMSEILILGYSAKATSVTLLDNSMNQSIEFLNDGLLYYQFHTAQENIKYFFAVLMNKKNKFMKKSLYEDILKLEVIAKKRYMNLGSPIAYEVYCVDFCFYFKDGSLFYFYWPLILDDDARYIAVIVEKKISCIEDKYGLLEAMKKGINIGDYLQGTDFK